MLEIMNYFCITYRLKGFIPIHNFFAYRTRNEEERNKWNYVLSELKNTFKDNDKLKLQEKSGITEQVVDSFVRFQGEEFGHHARKYETQTPETTLEWSQCKVCLTHVSTRDFPTHLACECNKKN